MKAYFIFVLSLLFSFCGSTADEDPSQIPSVVVEDAFVIEGNDGIKTVDFACADYFIIY